MRLQKKVIICGNKISWCIYNVITYANELIANMKHRRTLEKYAVAMNKLTVDVANKVAKSIGLESGNLFESWAINFVINGYNFSPETVGSPGIKLHTDTGFVTLLQDDAEVSGLEIQDVSGEFVDADPLPGSFCVNIGDSATVSWKFILASLHLNLVFIGMTL